MTKAEVLTAYDAAIAAANTKAAADRAAYAADELDRCEIAKALYETGEDLKEAAVAIAGQPPPCEWMSGPNNPGGSGA